MIFTTYARQPSPVRSHRLHLSFYLLESYVSRWMLDVVEVESNRQIRRVDHYRSYLHTQRPKSLRQLKLTVGTYAYRGLSQITEVLLLLQMPVQ